MAMQRSKESDEARQRATEMIASGVGDIASGVTGGVQAGQANMAEGLKFFGGQK